MSAKAKSKLTPEQRNATLRRVLEKIRPYGFFVVCSLIVAAVSVAAQLYIPILCGSAIDLIRQLVGGALNHRRSRGGSRGKPSPTYPAQTDETGAKPHSGNGQEV